MSHEPWLWVEALPAEIGAEVEVTGDEAAHLAGPLRRRPGGRVVLFDGAGTVARGTLAAVGGRLTRVLVDALEVVPRPPGEGVVVALALLHTQAMDWAVQKAVEVGVRCFVPVIAERSQGGRRGAAARLERWQRMVRQAAKQCRRPWLMEVAEPLELEALLTAWAGRGAVAAPGGGRVEDLPADLPSRLLVGPEGGLSEAEEERVASCGLAPLGLGPYILRAETAAVVGGAVLVARDRPW